MARAPLGRLLSLSLRCRGYAAAAAAAAAEAQRLAPAAMAARAEGGGAAAAGKEIFWMRDPKTGYWIPENRFADVDAVELRARLLGRKG